MLNNIYQSEFDLLSKDQQIEKGLEVTRKLTINNLDETSKILIPDDLQSFILLSIEVSPFPTESRKVMKYVETESLSKFIDQNHFFQVDNYCVIFANQEDLSYHNFENILNLDYLFNDVQFDITSKIFIEHKNIQIFKMGGSTSKLLALDQLNYYTIPLNNAQRGGRRLIFHSNQLSMALTKMINESEFFDKKNFRHVNSVFRLNNFAPGDKKFKAHYDTPFADKSNNLFSKYTMLIYLTGNKDGQKSNTPVLNIDGFALKSIQDNVCIIFDQKSEHEGNPYADKNKIFIRTELIYKITNYNYDEKIARMFNIACYMTKELDQQQYSADLFNNCVKMRYRQKGEQVQKVYLTKKCLDTVYVTDGNDYWFQYEGVRFKSNISQTNNKLEGKNENQDKVQGTKSSTNSLQNRITLKSIAMLIVMDYFNGRIKGLKNIKIKSKTFPRKKSEVEEDEINDETISNYLNFHQFPGDQIEDLYIDVSQSLSEFIPQSLCHKFNIFECQCRLKEHVYSDLYFKQGKRYCVDKEIAF